MLSSLLAVAAGCTEINPAYVGIGAPAYMASDGPDPQNQWLGDAASGSEPDAAAPPPPMDASGGQSPPEAAPAPDAGVDAPPDAALPIGTGLHADYFDGTMLENGTTGEIDLSRVDATIDFDWANGRADPNVDDDYFSVRWTGQVMPRYSELYTFTTVTDEGVRLWVNGVQLINQWVDQQGVSHAGQIPLVANQRYDIRMEYYERTGRASAQLYWSSATQANEIVPSTRLFEP